MDRGFNRELNSFTQTYRGLQTDAALLALPQVGFLADDGEHLLGTVAQLERELRLSTASCCATGGNFPQAFSHFALVRAPDAMHRVDRLSMPVKTPS
jgi:GH15 family glucan-1,4-alpha-glucosidase